MVRKIATQVQSNQLVSDRREQIIKAAITVFHERGFHVATTGDIAKEAGLTQSNLYNYVNSKQDVLLLVCNHLVGLYNTIIDGTMAQHSDPYTCLVECLDAIIRAMANHREEVQLLYHETHALEKRDRMSILTAISGFINRFELLIDNYEEKYDKLELRNKRLAANFLSFVPAMSALRSWDLAGAGSRNLNQGILQFILAGLGIPYPKRPTSA
jgi:TetR/AcrR family transcriptional regulator, cholesterol catabolism regulator